VFQQCAVAQINLQAATNAASAAPPQTMQEALTSPHGRPPIALAAFGFGGRVVVMRPRTRQPFPVSPPQGALRGSSTGGASLQWLLEAAAQQDCSSALAVYGA
jgi:hypothetical protein